MQIGQTPARVDVTGPSPSTATVVNGGPDLAYYVGTAQQAAVPAFSASGAGADGSLAVGASVSLSAAQWFVVPKQLGSAVLDVRPVPSQSAQSGSIIVSDTRPDNPAPGLVRIGLPYSGGPTAPGQVTGLSVTPGNTQAALSWTAPASNGGASITDYTVEYRVTSAGGSWTAFAHSAGTATSRTVTGLTNSTGYDFRVSAVNSAGTGTPSSTQTGTPTASATAPAQVTGLSLTPGNGQIVANWTAPSNGGSAITDYKVEIRNPGGTGSYTIFADGTSTSTSATITGLTNGTSVDVRVSAVNAVGTGTASAASNATPASAAFDPMTLSPSLWLRASDLTGSDGDQKDLWADRSGNGNDAVAPGGAGPHLDLAAVNGHAALTFEGYYAAVAGIVNDTAARTVFIVASRTGAAGNQWAWSLGVQGVKDNSGAWAYEETQAAGTHAIGGDTTAGFSIVGIRYNSASSADSFLGAAGTAQNFNPSDLYESGSSEPLRLGRHVSAGFWNGSIAEVFVVDRALTGGEIASLQTSLATYYAL